MAKIEYIGYLEDKVGYRTIFLKLEDKMPIRKAIEFPLEEEDVIILIDGKIGNLDSLVDDGSQIIVMPVMSGG